MNNDIVTELLRQWAVEYPEMDTSALDVVVRIQVLGKLLQRRTARALAVHGLKHWEYDVLSVLRRQGEPFEMPATDIAREALLTSGAMTTRIDGLEKRGLLRRRKSKRDGRSILVGLTKKGQALIDFAIDTRLKDANQAMEMIPPKEKQKLASALQRLSQQADAAK